jgi:hypothetical protein
MTFQDVVKLAGAIMASLGGAGVIIFGLSGFLGKLWADRALAADRQRYEQLNLEMKNQLDNASKRLQMELDTNRLGPQPPDKRRIFDSCRTLETVCQFDVRISRNVEPRAVVCPC